MTKGAALLLIAAGAVLRFAVATTTVYGIDLHMIGDILMAVGAVGLVLWLVIWLPRSRSRRAAYEAPPDVPPRPREPYRDGRYGDGYPADQAPADRYPTEPYRYRQHPHWRSRRPGRPVRPGRQRRAPG